MNSRDYWAEREAEALKHRITDEKEYDRQIKKIYAEMLDGVQEQINSFYGRYADKEGITLAEAKKKVSALDIAAYERKAKRYVKDKDFSKQANEEMRLYNLTMKVNRLEMLKANIGLELIAGHSELEKFIGGILKGRTMDELERQAGILGKTIRNNAQKAHAIVNGSFHNATFSDRIWQYQDLMRHDLGKTLQSALIQGKNPRAVAKEMQKYWYGNDPRTGGGAVYCMERLMRTELARVQTEAQKQSFERNGFEHYEFIANHDCCDICRGLDGKHFKVAKMRPGENAAPMHPNCRCSVAAWEDSKDYEAWLDYLEQGGSTEEWNKMKEIRNDAARQEQIRARRAAYHKRKTASQTKIPNFDAMDKTQLETWAANNLKTPLENTKGVNVDFLRETVKVFHQFETKNGGSIDGIKISFGGVGSGRYAEYDFKTKTLRLKKSGSIEAFAESQQAENARALRKSNKRRHSTTDFAGTVWHEIGHAVDHDEWQGLSRALSATKELEIQSVKISSYAGSSPAIGAPRRSEAWAENFAAYMSGENSAEVPPEIVKMIEEYFKKGKKKQ